MEGDLLEGNHSNGVPGEIVGQPEGSPFVQQSHFVAVGLCGSGKAMTPCGSVSQKGLRLSPQYILGKDKKQAPISVWGNGAHEFNINHPSTVR
eukprot:6464358-Amphidinium_carterae.1